MDSGLLSFLIYGVIAIAAFALLVRNILKYIKENKETDGKE